MSITDYLRLLEIGAVTSVVNTALIVWMLMKDKASETKSLSKSRWQPPIQKS